MPVMDGYDTIRAIRGTEQHKHLTVIAVTGKVMAGERKRCMDAGADDYVPKPVDQAELFAALRPWLPQSRPTCPADRRTRVEPSAPTGPIGCRSPSKARARRDCGSSWSMTTSATSSP